MEKTVKTGNNLLKNININLTLEICGRFILLDCLFKGKKCIKIKLSLSDTPINKGKFLHIKEEIIKIVKGEKNYSYLFDLTCDNRDLMVYRKLTNVPCGSTVTYSHLSEIDLGITPRVVGNILSRNPLPIVIPCHRVIGKDNTLKGYAYGIEIKRLLLEWEAGL